jgi:hypothetical protein
VTTIKGSMFSRYLRYRKVPTLTAKSEEVSTNRFALWQQYAEKCSREKSTVVRVVVIAGPPVKDPFYLDIWRWSYRRSPLCLKSTSTLSQNTVNNTGAFIKFYVTDDTFEFKFMFRKNFRCFV